MVVPSTLVTERVEAIDRFYAGVDEKVALDFLNQYDVSYIVVGGYERAYYSGLSLAKFETMAGEGLLRVAYQNEGTVIYEVIR